MGKYVIHGYSHAQHTRGEVYETNVFYFHFYLAKRNLR